MMKTKFSLLIFALLFVCSGMMAQDKITIGVIQYDLGDVDKSFKDLHDQGFGSCELNYGEFYQFNLSSCIRQQNSLTAQFVSFSLSNLANIFYPPNFYNN